MRFTMRVDAHDPRPEGERTKRGRVKVAGGHIEADTLEDALRELADWIKGQPAEARAAYLGALLQAGEYDDQRGL